MTEENNVRANPDNYTFEQALEALVEKFNEDSITEIHIAEALVKKAKGMQGGSDAINAAGTDIEIADLEVDNTGLPGTFNNED